MEGSPKIKEPTHLTVLVDTKHYEALIVGLTNLEIDYWHAGRIEVAYIYGKFVTQLIHDFHVHKLCPYPEDKCEYDEKLKEFREKYHLQIDREFHQLINSNK